jgi:GNAT superfamily N-acetyltransferase
VAEAHGRIIGGVRLWTDGWICAFFIDPQYQQQGIGTRLLQQIERIAKKRGFKALRTHSAINSVGFYKKRGYRVVRQVVFRNYGRMYRMFKRL